MYVWADMDGKQKGDFASRCGWIEIENWGCFGWLLSRNAQKDFCDGIRCDVLAILY